MSKPQASVRKLDTNFYEVTIGKRWYTAAFRPDRQTISGQWFITSDIGRTVDYWGPTGQKISNAVRASWSGPSGQDTIR